MKLSQLLPPSPFKGPPLPVLFDTWLPWHGDWPWVKVPPPGLAVNKNGAVVNVATGKQVPVNSDGSVTDPTTGAVHSAQDVAIAAAASGKGATTAAQITALDAIPGHLIPAADPNNPAGQVMINTQWGLISSATYYAYLAMVANAAQQG
jgi:hypothetical protein